MAGVGVGVVMFEGTSRGRATAVSRKDAKTQRTARGRGKYMREMEKGFFTTVFDKLRLYERARGVQRGGAHVNCCECKVKN